MELKLIQLGLLLLCYSLLCYPTVVMINVERVVMKFSNILYLHVYYHSLYTCSSALVVRIQADDAGFGRPAHGALLGAGQARTVQDVLNMFTRCAWSARMRV